jgi:hypothetical protein
MGIGVFKRFRLRVVLAVADLMQVPVLENEELYGLPPIEYEANAHRRPRPHQRSQSFPASNRRGIRKSRTSLHSP